MRAGGQNDSRIECQVLRQARRIVVKVGSSLVTNEGRGLDAAAIGEWCRQLAAGRGAGGRPREWSWSPAAPLPRA
jgi:hypothetical protein